MLGLFFSIQCAACWNRQVFPTFIWGLDGNVETKNGWLGQTCHNYLKNDCHCKPKWKSKSVLCWFMNVYRLVQVWSEDVCRCVLTVLAPCCLLYSAQPPLIQAIFSGDPEEIRMLIYKSEDINALVRRNIHTHRYSGEELKLVTLTPPWLFLFHSLHSCLCS